MANDIVKPVELYGQNNSGDVRRFACGNNNTITKGSVLKLVDARTASHSYGTTDIPVGIASMDKEPLDGSTDISVWTNGIFEMCSSGAISIGAKVKSAGYNNVIECNNTTDVASNAYAIGVALEAGTDGEIINVRVLL